MTFNSSIIADDGALATSYSRAMGIPANEAKERVAEDVSQLVQGIKLVGSASFGNLGYFSTTANDGVTFTPSDGCRVNNALASLVPVDVDMLATIGAKKPIAASSGAMVSAVPAVATAEYTIEHTANHEKEKSQPRVSRWVKLRNGAAGIAASVAIIATLTLFLLNPIRMVNEPQKASLAPIPTESVSVPAENTQKARPVRRLTIGLPSEVGYTILTQDEVIACEQSRKASASANTAQLMSDNDQFCVVVASFPTMSQARSYISTKGGDLGILEKDGKCRVYAATAPTFEMANAMRDKCGIADAWVCRR